MNLPEFGKLLVGMAAAMELGFTAEMEKVGALVEAEAKDMIGNDASYSYNISPLPSWPRLAEVTLEDKTQQGYSPPDNPLRRVGILQQSIQHSAGPMAAHIGSDDPVALWQELGTTSAHPIP